MASFLAEWRASRATTSSPSPIAASNMLHWILSSQFLSALSSKHFSNESGAKSMQSRLRAAGMPSRLPLASVRCGGGGSSPSSRPLITLPRSRLATFAAAMRQVARCFGYTIHGKRRRPSPTVSNASCGNTGTALVRLRRTCPGERCRASASAICARAVARWPSPLAAASSSSDARLLPLPLASLPEASLLRPPSLSCTIRAGASSCWPSMSGDGGVSEHTTSGGVSLPPLCALPRPSGACSDPVGFCPRGGGVRAMRATRPPCASAALPSLSSLEPVSSTYSGEPAISRAA
mmetsp:Transcript_11479/g.48166  ORF Transcript_11479/g.48166 Transcript_11479/m.48166 type:complete len:292 (+) Transcript_11479:12696-13571(+)